MSATTLDRLLATLDVELSAFAHCEVQQGYQLHFAAMETAIVHYVLAGRGVVVLSNGTAAELAPGRMVLVPPGQAQWLGTDNRGRSVRQVNADERSAKLGPDGLVRFTAGLPKAEGMQPLVVVCGALAARYGGSVGMFDTLTMPLTVDAADVAGLHGSFSLLLAELSHPRFGTRTLTTALMKQCLVLLLRHELGRDDGSLLFNLLRDPRLARAVTAVLENPAAPFTVAALAGIAGMSRTTFALRFAEAYGEPPIEFVQRVRLGHAATLLRSTALPVKVVAAAVGYGSRSHFSRAFHAAYGQDPSSFRQARPQLGAA